MKTPRLVVCATCLFAITWGADAAAATLTVDPGDPGAYSTIGAALADADDGDTVMVEAATYYESVVITQANLTLEGVDSPVIDGECAKATGIEIAGDGVTVAGFVVTKFKVGIEINGSESSVVRENAISNAKDAIVLDGAVACEVRENSILVVPGECTVTYEPDEGIQAEDGEDNLICENEIQGLGEEDVGDKGIQIEDVRDTLLENVVIGAGGDSIRIDGDYTQCIENLVLGGASDGFDVGNDGNLFMENEVVASADEGNDIDGTENEFIDNTAHGNADDAYELDSESIGNNLLMGNLASGDTESGFDVECPNNLLIDNTASGNGESGFHLELFVEDDEVNAANGNLLENNVAAENEENGFSLENVEGNELKDNQALGNGGYGFTDNNSAANVYSDNTCAGNVLGPSDPLGLCDCAPWAI